MPEYIPAGKFKAECLEIMDRVKRTRRRYIITKRKVPIAQIVPLNEEKEETIFGCMRGTGRVIGDIISPIDEEWDACQ